MAIHYVSAALILGWVVPRIQGGALTGVNPRLGQDQVIAFLSSVATGMMAFTGIVFSLLFIVLQVGSSAYSPHLVRMLMRNPVLSHGGGVYTGTFLYSLMALQGVGAIQGGTTALTVWVAFAWLLGSVYFLARLVDVFSSLEIADVLEMLGGSARREIDRVYGPYSAEAAALAQGVRRAPPGALVQTVVHSGKPQYLLGLDIPRLVALASAAGAVIRIPLAVGDPVSPGVCLATVEGAGLPEEALRAGIEVGKDRTLEQGPKQTIRLLVDIAIRALSPAINDPTTAVSALDQIEALLRWLGGAHLDVGAVSDAAGVVRLVHETPGWEDYLELGVTEIQQYGVGSVQVERRLAALFAFLSSTLPEARRAAVERLATTRLALVREAFPEGLLRDQAERRDRQGLGSSGRSQRSAGMNP